MNKHFILFLFLTIIVMGLASAQPPGQQSSIEKGLVVESAFSEIHKQGNPLYVHAHVFNSSNGVPLYSSVATYVGCHYHAYSHNLGGEHIVTNGVMTSYGVGWNGSIAGNYFNETGRYSVLIWCNSTTDGGFLEYSFDVIPSGNKNSIYLLIFMIVIAMVLFIFSIQERNPYIGFVASSLFIICGIYIMINGVDLVSNEFSMMLSYVVLGFGLMAIFAAVYEMFYPGFGREDE